MFEHDKLREVITRLTLAFLFCAPAYARPQAVPQRSVPDAPARVPARPADIISDNLDRVAASADQILEVLNREAGLMVELKSLLAKDAGASGQILEESDLSDAAISERLKQDLHTRVLATRLLRQYGYLVAKINPDSELAAEHNLAMRERVVGAERAAERGNAAPQTVINLAPGTPPPAMRPPGRTVDGVLDESHPDVLTAPGEATLPATQGTMLTSAREVNTATDIAANVPGAPQANTATDIAANVPGAPQPAHRNAGAPPAEIEPVRMDRRPNPYADVPSLYDLYVQAASPNRKMERFGLDIFRSGAANPDILPMDLPVGPDYIVGPGDSLAINLWGGVSQRLLRTVDREGRLVLPETGPLLVSGRNLGDVQQEVQRVLRTEFRDVSAEVSLLRLRTVRVYVVGDVAEPGAYDVSSLSTPLNALFAAGGVTLRGSLRRLAHYRGKQLIEEVDAYDLLLHGIRGDLKRLENGDSLLVPPLGPVITVDGMVRRQALYELRGEKNLEDALDLAGGILPAAALRHIEVQRLVAHETRTMLSLEIGETSDPEAVRAQLRGFAVQDGDEVHIFPIAPYNSRAIYLEGHVLRPGRYSYKPDMKLTDLVTSYADLLPEPSTRYAEIIRLHAPDYHPVVETFDLATALEHPETAPTLEPLDTVRIFGRYDFEPDPEVLVTGEVRAPGWYRSSGQQHLRDAIYQAGGVTPDAGLDSAQIFRRQPDGTTRIFSINLGDALTGDPVNNVLVQPRDRILVHRQPEQVSPATVYVRGEVARPGRYPLVVNMRVSDLVRSAGGLLRSANPDSGDLAHYAISNSSGERGQAGHQDLSLAAAMAGNEEQNLPLQDGDVLTVPQQAGWNDIGAVVTLRGEVSKPGVYGIRPGEHLSSLLRRAGGLLPTAYPRAAVFEREEVRELQQKSRQELIQRLEQESTVVKTAASTTGTEEAALQQAAMQQRQRALDGLRRAPVSGRLVIHLRPDRAGFARSPDDIELRAGDSLVIPKQPGAVLVIGQVYNANALTYTPGKNARWYLSRAGGATPLANKGEIFIVRCDGSVSLATRKVTKAGSHGAFLFVCHTHHTDRSLQICQATPSYPLMCQIPWKFEDNVDPCRLTACVDKARLHGHRDTRPFVGNQIRLDLLAKLHSVQGIGRWICCIAVLITGIDKRMRSAHFYFDFVTLALFRLGGHVSHSIEVRRRTRLPTFNV
jgi:protein involved in polysaccharide export with SLBB domain